MTYERQSRQGSNRGLRAFGEQAQPGIDDACLIAFGAGVQWPSSPASVTMARHSYFSDGATIPRWKSPPFFIYYYSCQQYLFIWSSSAMFQYLSEEILTMVLFWKGGQIWQPRQRPHVSNLRARDLVRTCGLKVRGMISSE